MKRQKSTSIVIVVVTIALAALTSSCTPDEKLFRIQKDGLYGFINKSGETVIDPKYDYVSGFTKDGYAMIILDASIDTIQNAMPLSDIIVTDTTLRISYNYIDKKGNMLLSSNEEIILKKTEPWLLYNEPQEFVDKFNSHTLGFREYVLPELDIESDRYVFQSDNYMIGYKDKKGNTIIEPKFTYGRRMTDGLAFVIDSMTRRTDFSDIDIFEYTNSLLNRTRLIDANGNYITEMKMHDFWDFNNWGYAWVSVSNIDTNFVVINDWFRIDRTGRITCGPVTPGIRGTVYNNYLSEEPLYLVEFSFGILGSYYTWVDDEGNYITDFDKNGTVSLFFSGEELSELYQDVTPFSGGVAGVKMFNGEGESAWIFINRSFDIISDPYDSICPFRNGFAAVQRKDPNWQRTGNWGFVGFDIDSSIVQKIPFNFSEVGNFNKEGLAYASVRGAGYIKEGYINTDGIFIWETLRKRQ